jgi:hypothetical protein
MPAVCFVMLPFQQKFMALYEDVLAPVARGVGLEPRTGSSYEPGSIPAQIEQGISTASVAIAVLTDGNWNVAYEMGIAHKANVPVIAVIEAAPDDLPRSVPFDVRHHRVLPYRPTEEGLRQLQHDLRESLPKLYDEHLLADMLSPASIKSPRSVIAASPLAYRDARRKIGGVARFRETSSDHVGIRGLLRGLAIIRGFEGLPELWNPGDFLDTVLIGGEHSPPSEMTVFSIGSPKSNHFTGLLMDAFFARHRPSFAFVADETSRDLRDVRVALKRDGQLCLDGLDPAHDDRRYHDLGLVVRGPNPFSPGSMMMILAGRSALGTEAACRAAVEPHSVQSILHHLEADASARHIPKPSLKDHARSFVAVVTMRRDPHTRERDPSSLVVEMARFCEPCIASAVLT